VHWHAPVCIIVRLGMRARRHRRLAAAMSTAEIARRVGEWRSSQQQTPAATSGRAMGGALGASAKAECNGSRKRVC
jgi:hypothetical protein